MEEVGFSVLRDEEVGERRRPVEPYDATDWGALSIKACSEDVSMVEERSKRVCATEEGSVKG